MNDLPLHQSKFTHFFTENTLSAPFWLIVRLYLGYEWIMAGYGKIVDPVWFGSQSGVALKGFVQGAIAKTAGAHPDVSMWYASFLQNVVLPHPALWSHAIAIGELLVGLGLIVGLFTGVAAFFGFLMNFNYLLAGTVSLNPVMLVLALMLVSASRVAGYWGLDRFAQPWAHRWCNSCKKKAIA